MEDCFNMQKLAAADASFLYSETPRCPNHVASVQIFELPGDTTSGAFIEELKLFISNRVDLVPYLTRKLQLDNANLDHPFWISDCDFDINNHITEVRLSGAGDDAELEDKIAELHAVPMDRSKPLWALRVITGLTGGKIAYYNQVHHACIDGVAAQAATELLMDNSPVHPFHRPPQHFPAAEKPSATDLFLASLENFISLQLDNNNRFFGTVDSFVRAGQRAIDPSKGFGALAQPAPRTVFNHCIDQARSFATGELPLGSVKSLGRLTDSKVNDVFMAVCAGGLRKYLQENDTLPATGLIAGCPVSLRMPGDTRMNNQVTMMKVNLATDIADPRLRMLAIRDSATTAKQVTADLAGAMNSDVSMPGLPDFIKNSSAAAERLNLAEFASPAFNVLISNVPGPKETLYSNGARMLTHYPVSIPAHGLALNITVQSYGETLYFGITACRKALPDARRLRDDMLSAFKQLENVLTGNAVTALEAGKKTESTTIEDRAPRPAMGRVA